MLDDLADPADLDGLWPSGRAGRVLVTCADAAAVPRGMQVMPVGLFNSREALSYLTERLSANRGQRLGAIDLVNAMGLEPVALTQASAVIASSAMSCHNYQDNFVRWREQLTEFFRRTAVGQRGHLAALVRARQLSLPRAGRSSRYWPWPRCSTGTAFPEPS